MSTRNVQHNMQKHNNSTHNGSVKTKKYIRREMWAWCLIVSSDVNDVWNFTSSSCWASSSTISLLSAHWGEWICVETEQTETLVWLCGSLYEYLTTPRRHREREEIYKECLRWIMNETHHRVEPCLPTQDPPDSSGGCYSNLQNMLHMKQVDQVKPGER